VHLGQTPSDTLVGVFFAPSKLVSEASPTCKVAAQNVLSDNFVYHPTCDEWAANHCHINHLNVHDLPIFIYSNPFISQALHLE
jgi:hypothetical protein